MSSEVSPWAEARGEGSAPGAGRAVRARLFQGRFLRTNRPLTRRAERGKHRRAAPGRMQRSVWQSARSLGPPLQKRVSPAPVFSRTHRRLERDMQQATQATWHSALDRVGYRTAPSCQIMASTGGRMLVRISLSLDSLDSLPCAHCPVPTALYSLPCAHCLDSVPCTHCPVPTALYPLPLCLRHVQAGSPGSPGVLLSG